MASTVLQPLSLLRNILRLHRKLPPMLRSMGDGYVMSEFRRHKNAPNDAVNAFMREWESYYISMSGQVQHSGTIKGENLPPDQIEKLTDNQISQLYDLKVESSKYKLHNSSNSDSK